MHLWYCHIKSVIWLSIYVSRICDARPNSVFQHLLHSIIGISNGSCGYEWIVSTQRICIHRMRVSAIRIHLYTRDRGIKVCLSVCVHCLHSLSLRTHVGMLMLKIPFTFSHECKLSSIQQMMTIVPEWNEHTKKNITKLHELCLYSITMHYLNKWEHTFKLVDKHYSLDSNCCIQLS